MSAPVLELRGLQAGYGGAKVLFGVDLRVNPGEVVALVGRNGAGKSTTMRAVMNLVPERAGQILLEGRDLGRAPVHEVAAAGVGYVPEDRRVFSKLSVDENLEVGRRPPRPGLPPWTEERLFELFPNLAGMRGRPAGMMSGGEQQMLSVARTLIGNPKLVLLDEPSEGLAPMIVAAMAEAVVSMKQAGLSVLLAEQNLSFAGKVADRGCLLRGGKVALEGPIERLRGAEAEGL